MWNYNYVLFNSYDNKHAIDRNGYYYICAQELESSPDIKVVTFPLDYCPKLSRLLFDIHNSQKISRFINLPFKKLWYPYYFKNDFKTSKPFCFIIINRSLPIDYLRYLKDRYSDCRIVLLHRDLIAVAKSINTELPGNPIFDLEMTFDKGESEKYNIPYFSEFESKIEIEPNATMESDVFFAGKAKDRLPLLLSAYDIFSKAGLRCKYFLTGVPIEMRIHRPGIEYSDSFMSYKEMLLHSINTKCLLEINQGNCNGYTSRFLEAVIYRKRLITNNTFIKESIFYSPDKIQVVDNISDIKASFVTSGSDFIDYNYNGEFSPFRMIERVEEELIKKYNI